MSKATHQEAWAYLQEKFDFATTEFITAFLENVLALIDDSGNLLQEGNHLFEYLGELSKRLETAHPDSQI